MTRISLQFSVFSRTPSRLVNWNQNQGETRLARCLPGLELQQLAQQHLGDSKLQGGGEALVQTESQLVASPQTDSTGVLPGERFQDMNIHDCDDLKLIITKE